jgi:hypothetical protein
MPAFIKNLTVDCVDAMRVARFWMKARRDRYRRRG